jgi:hypothetical protein
MASTDNLFCLFSLRTKNVISFLGSSVLWQIYTIHEQIVTIMVNVKHRNGLWKGSDILPLPLEYTFSFVNLIVNNHGKV